MALQERRAIKDTRLLIRALAVLALVIVGFGLHRCCTSHRRSSRSWGWERCCGRPISTSADVLPEVEWPTLAFFMGLFAMVAGLVHTGVIERSATWPSRHSVIIASWRPPRCLRSAYPRRVHRQHPLYRDDDPGREGMVARHRMPRPDGRCGGRSRSARLRCNAPRRGQRQRRRDRIAHRAGHPISFWKFTKYGIVVTVLQHHPGVGLRLAPILLNPLAFRVCDQPARTPLQAFAPGR